MEQVEESLSSTTSIQNRAHNQVDDGFDRKNETIALAILDLPIGSIINIDGTVIVLQRDDFIGIHSIPKTALTSTPFHPIKAKSNAIFHLVTIRGGSTKANVNIGASAAPTTTVGFLIRAHGIDNEVVARRYDPHTEEVSANHLDPVTINNLVDKVHNNHIDPQRIVSYRDITSNENEELWRDSTNFISDYFLKKIKKLQHGNKIVPGAYEFDNANDVIDGHQNDAIYNHVDGIPILYPPIPVFAKNIRGKHFSSNNKVKAVSAHRHLGTRRFLQSLNPSLRTSFCCATNGTNPANTALTYIIKQSYDERWEYLLGDVQLSFILFLHLQCYTSYTYWRDVIAMMSAVDENSMTQHMNMYSALFRILSVQIQSIDNDEGVFSDIDLSDDDSFLLPSLQQLLSTASKVTLNMNQDSFNASLLKMKAAVKGKFSSRFGEEDSFSVTNLSVIRIMESDDDAMYGGAVVDDNEDDDVPVILSTEEIEESYTRSQEYLNELDRYYHATDLMKQNDRKLLSRHYPLLLAAMDSSSGKEDVLMTCARVIHDTVDASLVREAAAYLVDVESKKTGD
jgi:AAR2 protein